MSAVVPEASQDRRRSSISVAAEALGLDLVDTVGASDEPRKFRWKLLSRVLVGLLFTYSDLITDILVCASLYGTDLFVPSLSFLVLPLFFQSYFSKVVFRQPWSDFALSLTGLKPVIDSYRVLINAPGQDSGGVTWSQDTILAMTKMCEVGLESFPQSLIQANFALSTPEEDRSWLVVLSIASSFAAIAFSLASGTVGVDRSDDFRATAPWLHGFTGDGIKSSGLLFEVACWGGLVLFFSGYSAAAVFGFAALSVTGGFPLVCAVLFVYLAVYGVVKYAEKEFVFFITSHPKWKNSLKTGAAFQFMLWLGTQAAPAPLFRVPGVSNPHIYAGMISFNLFVAAPVSLAVAYALRADVAEAANCLEGGDNATDVLCNGGTGRLELSPGKAAALLAGLVGTALFGIVVFFSFGMVKSFRWTFFSWMTYREQVRRDFERADEEEGKEREDGLMVYLTARPPYYWPEPESLVQSPLFVAHFHKWRKNPPPWMTAAWKEDLPDRYLGAFFPPSVDDEEM